MKSPKLSSLYLIIIIFLLHSFLVICENECADCDIDEDNHKCKVKQTCIDGGENCACDINKCRPNLYSTPGTCYYCQDLSPSKFYVISGGTCSVKTQASECNKITYENNECVDNCGDGFSLGDYCFKTCYTNLGLIAETISNTCICQNYYVELDINGKKFLNVWILALTFMTKSPKNVLINVLVILKELPILMVVKKNVWMMNFYIQLILVEKLNIIVLSPARIW
jgi:hypothetical protein